MSKQARLHTIFRYCLNVTTMRHFYSELLGLNETSFGDGETHGWLTYQLGETQLVFVRTDYPLPLLTEFAQQPGYKGGDIPATSWVIEMNEADFNTAVAHLQSSQFPRYQEEPLALRPGHKQYYVLDPMGHTVELYTEGGSE